MSSAPQPLAPISEAIPPGGRVRLRRDTTAGIVGGVVAGFSRRFGIEVSLLRLLFVIAVIVTGGILLAGYAIAWVTIPSVGTDGRSVPARLSGRAGRKGVHLGLGVGLLTVAALLVFRELGIWWSDAIVWPVALAGGGAALLWGQSRSRVEAEAPIAEPPRAALSGAPAAGPAQPSQREFSPVLELYRGGFGIALVVGAGLLFLSQNDALGGARDAAFTAIVAIVALALILAPFIWRLGRNLASERAERIRSQERAEVATHLHDSVLQTLTLLQKRADDPREVSALARRQERELRSWLAGERSERAGGFASTLATVAEGVEDAHRVKIDLVQVGDCELDEGTDAVVAATREALTNAAKFAGEDGPISLYAEVGESRVEVYVRDRGPGFDPAEVPADRQGLRESIVGRMRRFGGEANVSSIPGTGTEVTIEIDRENGGEA